MMSLAEARMSMSVVAARSRSNNAFVKIQDAMTGLWQLVGNFVRT